MKRATDVLILIERVTVEQLQSWVAEDWVRPAQTGDETRFSDADIARIRLIDTLVHEFEVGEEAVPIILSLIDQIHDLRAEMRSLAEAIEDLPGDARLKLLNLLGKTDQVVP